MARNDEGGNVVFGPRSIRLGAGKGGEIMKLIGAIFLFIVFVSPIYAQGLFDQAEIEFNVDYIDIGNVQILGSKAKGQVMVVWMKSGSVLTKTLSNSKIKYSDREDREFDNGGDYTFTPESVYTEDRVQIEELRKKPVEELILRASDLINGEWGDHTTFRLFDVIFALKLEGNRGSEFVQLTMDVIKANLKYENRPRRLLAEKDMMLQFAEGDEQLTKDVNNFLKENGFEEHTN